MKETGELIDIFFQKDSWCTTTVSNFIDSYHIPVEIYLPQQQQRPVLEKTF